MKEPVTKKDKGRKVWFIDGKKKTGTIKDVYKGEQVTIWHTDKEGCLWMLAVGQDKIIKLGRKTK